VNQQEIDMGKARREKIRRAVRYFYDLQKLRIQSGNRGGKQSDEAPAVLDESDKIFLAKQSTGLDTLEKDALKEVKRLLKGVPIYEKWLKDQKGCGVTLSGVLISEIDITKADTSSALWAYAGLHTDPETGSAMRRKKGVKANWNSFLKTKVVKILGDCLIKANSPWRSFYDSYKLRKQNQLVQVCMCCKGEGKAYEEEETEEEKAKVETEAKPKKKAKCKNCNGTGGPAPWGRSDAHRHAASIRYMVKMFLLELWKNWRTLEGLPVGETYAEAALGRSHGDHGGMGDKLSPKVNPNTNAPFKPVGLTA